MEYAVVKSSSASRHVTTDSVDLGSHDRYRLADLPHDGSSGSKVAFLEKLCNEERHNREVWQAKAEEAREKLKQTRLRVSKEFTNVINLKVSHLYLDTRQ